MYLFILVVFNLLFFWKFWKKPELNNTSEMGTTFFPHWIWMGKELKSGKLPLRDKIYYKYPASIPFLSTFYPPHFISAFFGAWMPLNWAFRLLTCGILAHYIWGSILVFILFLGWATPEVALFGSLLLFYSGYAFKIQQPCIIYTMAWIPGIFFDGWVGIFSMGMALLGGYYPILIYLMPFILVVHTETVLLGTLLALPQIIPFLWYFKHSVRWKEKVSHKVGRLSLIGLGKLFLPLRPRTHTNGVMFMETEMYMSLIPFLLIWFSSSRFWYVLAFGLLIAVGVVKPWQRIPARALYIVTLSITILATDGLNKLGLTQMQNFAFVFLTGFLLLFNRDIYPCFPFSQWKVGDYTGYLLGVKKHEYHGAFRLQQ